MFRLCVLISQHLLVCSASGRCMCAGVHPQGWPPDLLAAVAQTQLPLLDLYHVPSSLATNPDADLVDELM